MKVLVTGSAGQLGSYVCEALRGRHEISGLDLRPAAPGLRSISHRGDIRRRTDVRKSLRNVEAVVHCAAQVSVELSTEDPLGDAKTNVLGTLNLLDEAYRSSVAKFIYVSSAAVYGNPRRVPVDEAHPTEPMSNYGASKLSGEKYALAYAQSTPIQASVIRPFNFYSVRADPKSPYSGVMTKFVTRVKAGKPPIIEGDGKQTRDFVHVRDVVEMIRLMLENEGLSGQVFNCGSGKATTVLSLAKMAIELGGKDLEPEFTDARRGDIRHSQADIRRARKALGFVPRVKLREGLAEMLR